MVAIVDVGLDVGLQLVDVAESVQIEELIIERSEGTLHRGVIEAVAFARNALPDFLLFQPAAIDRHLLLPALIRMQDRLVTWPKLREGLFQHRVDHVE